MSSQSRYKLLFTPITVVLAVSCFVVSISET